ncbi:MAG: hypothetical protein M3430_16730 [Acidobacteriota bacterium]|nr:hypothetical protein [Acidobacteriota bacterium]
MTRVFLRALILVTITSVAANGSLAQDAPAPNASPTPDAESALYTYKVAHDHRIGNGDGELRITETGIEYRGASDTEARHNGVWRDDDIKRLELSKTNLRVVTYEATQFPLIPRNTPKIREGKSVRFSSEREHEFRLVESEITPEVVRTLLARFKRPIATSVLPNEEEESGHLIFEISVFHRQRAGGASGTLRVHEDYVAFNSERDGHSRYWRYEDIRDIGRLGRYKFEIATYEGQFGGDGRSYIFDLKRPMTSREYDQLWAKIYEREQTPRLRRESSREDAQ